MKVYWLDLTKSNANAQTTHNQFFPHGTRTFFCWIGNQNAFFQKSVKLSGNQHPCLLDWHATLKSVHLHWNWDWQAVLYSNQLREGTDSPVRYSTLFTPGTRICRRSAGCEFRTFSSCRYLLGFFSAGRSKSKPFSIFSNSACLSNMELDFSKSKSPPPMMHSVGKLKAVRAWLFLRPSIFLGVVTLRCLPSPGRLLLSEQHAQRTQQKPAE